MPSHDGQPNDVNAAHRQPVDTVLAHQGTSLESGLSASEANARRRQHGPNRLPRSRGPSVWRILVNQVESLVVILLFSAAATAAAFGSTIEALAILAALLVNTVVGFAMVWRATRAMEALERMGTAQIHVRRDGKRHRIGADELVPGDIVLLEAGDMIMADMRLVESNRLQCDESALTGESVAVDKTTDPLPEADPAIADRHNMGYAGTAVTQGSGSGVVVATGLATELGEIARLVSESGQSITPLEKCLDRLGQRLIWLTLVVAVLVAGAGIVAGTDLRLMMETAIAMAIAAVPEGLPVVATLALALGLNRSEAGIMDRPPRDPTEPILMRRHWSAIGGYAVIIAATALAAFAVALLVLDLDTTMAVTISFLTFGFARLWHVFNMRSSRSQPIVNEVTRNGFVWVSVGAGVLLLLAATYFAPLAGILGVTPPGRREWLLILGFSLLPLLVVQPLKWAGLWWERAPTSDAS